MNLHLAAVIVLACAAVALSSGYRRGVMRLMKNSQLVADPNGHVISLACDNLWIVHFGPSFKKAYGASWAIGWQNKRIWYLHTKGNSHGLD